jgi:hypothetical protein
MKKKSLIIVIASLLLVGGGIALWYYFKKPKDELAKYIPKDAIVVVKLDMPGIAQKVDFSKMKELNAFQMLKKEMSGNKLLKKMFNNFMEDPSVIGIAFNKSPFMFVGMDGKGEESSLYAAVLFGISSEKKFNDFISMASAGMMEVRSNEGINYMAIEEDIKDGGLFFNDKVAMVVMKVEGRKINCKKIASNLFEMKSDESILSEKAFTEFQKNQMDISMFFNKTAINRLVDDNESRSVSRELSQIKTYLKYYPVGMSLNFEEDAIRFKTYADPSAPADNAIMKDNGMSATDLKYFAPDGKPLAYLTLNMDVKNYYNMIMNLVKMDGNRTLNQIENEIDDFTDESGITKSDLLNTLAGNMSVSLTGFEKKSYTYTDYYQDYYMYENDIQPEPEIRTTMVPVFVAHATMGNAVVYDFIASKAMENNSYADGIISIPTDNQTKEIIYITKKGKDLFISNKLSYVTDFKNGISWTSLDASCKRDMAANNPMSFFVNLQYRKYRDLMEDASPSDKKGMQLVMNELDCAVAYANKKDGTMEVLMTPEKKNALWRIFEMVDDAITKFN